VHSVLDTTYACNGARSGRSRLSYTFYHLRHRPDLVREDYIEIIEGAIHQYNATVLQSFPCMDDFSRVWHFYPAVSSLRAFASGDYATAKFYYTVTLMLASLDLFVPQHESCVYNFTSMSVEVGNPGDLDTVARNARGDMIIQLQHILYMMDRMLGQLEPALPPEFDPTP
jgi:hypothetical protein